MDGHFPFIMKWEACEYPALRRERNTGSVQPGLNTGVPRIGCHGDPGDVRCSLVKIDEQIRVVVPIRG